jgi:hypothetical protein
MLRAIVSGLEPSQLIMERRMTEFTVRVRLGPEELWAFTGAVSSSAIAQIIKKTKNHNKPLSLDILNNFVISLLLEKLF